MLVKLQMKKDDLENSDKKKDESIIDVNLESLDLSINKEEVNMKVVHRKKNNNNVPKWSKQPLYSFFDIQQANTEQIKFYNYFSDKFRQNEFVNLEGNTNYAVILIYELVAQFESHQDLDLIDEQFKLLNKCCPEIESYTKSQFNELEKESMISTLLGIMSGKPAKKAKPTPPPIKSTSNIQIKDAFYDRNTDRLGWKYLKKLNLNAQETNWLNKFGRPKNAFTSIEGYLRATCKQYLLILNELDKALKAKKESIKIEVYYFTKKIKIFLNPSHTNNRPR